MDRPRRRRRGGALLRVHRAWWVALVTFLVLIASAAFRSSQGVMIVPIEEDLGWSRAITSLAISVNLVIYGVTAPFAAALMERFGVRRIAIGALALPVRSSCCLCRSWQGLQRVQRLSGSQNRRGSPRRPRASAS